MSNFSCIHILVVAFSINILFCILAYKYDYTYLLEGLFSAKIDRPSKSIPTAATIDNNSLNSTHYGTRTVSMNNNNFVNTFATSGHSHFSRDGMKNSKGYIIPYRIYEQQTSAARNLWGLQLWAKSVDMKVVEPFINKHGMSFEDLVNDTNNMADQTKFSELYDRNFWNSHTTERGCAPIVDWEEFLHGAPRKTILVLPHIFKSHKIKNTVVEIIDKSSKIIGSRNCGEAYFSESAMKFFKDLGFHYVREVCIKFSVNNALTKEKFAQHIFDEYEPSGVTVIFALWQGVRNTRINLSGVSLSAGETIRVGLMPSKSIIKESDNYVQQFVPAGSKYFGVMVRVERALRFYMKSHGFDKTMKYLTQCANGLAKLRQFKDHSEWKHTLAIDMGKFGSKGLLTGCLQSKGYCGIDKLFGLFFNSVFGDSWSIKDYEDSFTKYISTDNPAYVAQVQRTIAARADCIVMVGGKSNFQSAAISFYRNFHPNVSERCIIYHCYCNVNFDIDSV